MWEESRIFILLTKGFLMLLLRPLHCDQGLRSCRLSRAGHATTDTRACLLTGRISSQMRMTKTKPTWWANDTQHTCWTSLWTCSQSSAIMHAAPATVCFIIVSILKSVVLFEPSSAGCVEERSACQYGIHITATSAAQSITAPCMYMRSFNQSFTIMLVILQWYVWTAKWS